MVRLIEQSLPTQAKEIEPGSAGFVLIAPGFQPAGDISGVREKSLYRHQEVRPTIR